MYLIFLIGIRIQFRNMFNRGYRCDALKHSKKRKHYDTEIGDLIFKMQVYLIYI